jgi:hypothetical protein
MIITFLVAVESLASVNKALKESCTIGFASTVLISVFSTTHWQLQKATHLIYFMFPKKLKLSSIVYSVYILAPGSSTRICPDSPSFEY